MINSFEKTYEPLLQLPHTYFNIYEKNRIDLIEGRLFEDSPESRKNEWEENCIVAGLLLLIELVERYDITIDMTDADQAPMQEFFIITVPDELIEAFAFFETNRENKEIYDLNDIKFLGEAILNLPSKHSYTAKSLERLHDAFSGGIDEQTGLALLKFLFPNELPEEEWHEEIEITDTYWGEEDEEIYLMIDQLRNEISMIME